jgi:hypothetical protein
MDRIPELHLNVFSFACYPHIRAAQLAQKIKGWLRLLAQGKPQRVLLASLSSGFFNILGQPVKPVRGTPASDALMRSLVVVQLDNTRPIVPKPLWCIRGILGSARKLLLIGELFGQIGTCFNVVLRTMSIQRYGRCRNGCSIAPYAV